MQCQHPDALHERPARLPEIFDLLLDLLHLSLLAPVLLTNLAWDPTKAVEQDRVSP